MTDTAINTVVKLLVDVGKACAEYQNQALRNLKCNRLQCDEIWSFCYSKEKNVPEDKKGQFGYGDVWTWTAICADTKFVPSWLVGNRIQRLPSLWRTWLRLAIGFSLPQTAIRLI